MRMRLVVLAVFAAVAVPAAALGTGSAVVGLKATMNGSNEVPKGDPKATGRADLKLNAKTGQVCWKFTLKGVKGPSAAHIHKGGKGTAGPVVVPFGTAFKLAGCTKASPALVKAILAKPSSYYVNVHTAKYPAGSVRGQLAKTSVAGYGGY